MLHFAAVHGDFLAVKNLEEPRRSLEVKGTLEELEEEWRGVLQ